MKEEIHPDLKETTVTCACGEVYHTKSTQENIRVEVCSNCHPFYTGRKRKNAQGGRVERFNAKYGFTDEEESETGETSAEGEASEYEDETAE